MQNKPQKYVSTMALALAIPAINFVLFMVYYFAYPDLGLWQKLWNYLGSAVFTLVTGSLIIPLLFAILEKRYKFIENIQKQREDRRKQTEDRKRETRQEVINETIRMWQDLYNLTSEIIYFIPGKDGERELNELIIKLNTFTSTAEHIVNKWTHQFTNLTYQDQDVFLEFINQLYQSGLSVAYFIRNGVDDKERRFLQEMLLMIQDQIKNIANHRIINVLKYSAIVLDMKESLDIEANEKIIAEQDALIKDELGLLKDWASAMHDLNVQHDNFLAPAEGKNIDKVRQTAREIEKWLVADKNRFINKSDKFNDFQNQFYAIDLEERVSTIGIPYTKDYIRALADWLSFESASIYVYNRAHSIW